MQRPQVPQPQACRPAQLRRLQTLYKPAAAALQARMPGGALPDMRAWDQPAACKGVKPAWLVTLKHTSTCCILPPSAIPKTPQPPTKSPQTRQTR